MSDTQYEGELEGASNEDVLQYDCTADATTVVVQEQEDYIPQDDCVELSAELNKIIEQIVCAEYSHQGNDQLSRVKMADRQQNITDRPPASLKFNVKSRTCDETYVVIFNPASKTYSCQCSLPTQYTCPCPHIFAAWAESDKLILHIQHWGSRYLKETNTSHIQQSCNRIKGFTTRS